MPLLAGGRWDNGTTVRIQCCGQGAVNDIGTSDNVTGADLLLVLSDPLANAHMDIANWTRGGHGGDTGGQKGFLYYRTECSSHWEQ